MKKRSPPIISNLLKTLFCAVCISLLLVKKTYIYILCETITLFSLVAIMLKAKISILLTTWPWHVIGDN